MKSRVLTHRRLRRGFSIIEVLATLGILTIGIMGVAGLQIHSMASTNRGRDMTIAMELMRQKLEVCKSLNDSGPRIKVRCHPAYQAHTASPPCPPGTTDPVGFNNGAGCCPAMDANGTALAPGNIDELGQYCEFGELSVMLNEPMDNSNSFTGLNNDEHHISFMRWAEVEPGTSGSWYKVTAHISWKDLDGKAHHMYQALILSPRAYVTNTL